MENKWLIIESKLKIYKAQSEMAYGAKSRFDITRIKNGNWVS